MRLDLTPSSCSALVSFQACSQRTLESSEFSNAHTGLSEDGTLTWVYKGPVLEVVSTATGYRVTCLDVEHFLKDKDAHVVKVCEFKCRSRVWLLVAVSGTAEQGLVLVLDVASSMVVNSLEIPQQVTAMECVLTYGGSGVPAWALSEQLRSFHGILAVGTCGGYVYLIDMLMDCELDHGMDACNRQLPKGLRLLDLREREVEALRQRAVASRQHLAVPLGLNEQMNSNDCFHFRRPDLSIVQSYNEDEVRVSCLYYIPQSGTLAVGYNFGGFHLWKLFNPVLEHACSPEPEDQPVAFFVYQEPENDPKHFAYLWAGRDDCSSDEKEDSLCSISLYQLSYNQRTFYANYGNFYQELNFCLLRLDHVLTIDPYNSRNTTTAFSRLLSAVTISSSSHHPHSFLTANDSIDESTQGPDLSLCAFVWEAEDSHPGSSKEAYLAIFDMNRWYHAQMPSRIKCVNLGGQEICPYLAVYRMTEAVYKQRHGGLLNIGLRPGSLLRFLNHSPMPPEQHFYPSSLALDLICVMQRGIVCASILGLQRQVLASLEWCGPECLLKPFDLYQRCLQTGLLSHSPESWSTALSDEQCRSALLSLALEHGKIRFITACIHAWADGEFYQQGCTLQYLLGWLWGRVAAIKHQLDTTCQPLYNWCGAPVDQRLVQTLHNSLCCLGHIRTILQTMLNSATPLTDQGQAELDHRMRVVTLLYHHLRVVLWFIYNNLLPEHDENSELTATHYVYPASMLLQVFQQRRQRISQSSRDTASHEVMLIDALVHEAGPPLVDLWKNLGGSGVYPPPSLYAAMAMLLLDNVAESTKQAVLIYLLFDMANTAHGLQKEVAEKIPQFVQTFDIQLGFMQQVHGFWLIDHMNFQDGIPILLQHSSSQAIGSWQHGCVLRSLLLQGELGAAARYLALRNPPVLTPEDLRTRLTILVANRLVWQAVSHVRHNCGPTEREAMLRHIFTQCQQRKVLELALQLPLDEDEELCLKCYLSENTDAASSELLVLHLLQRAQYVPAIRLNERIKHRATMDLSAKARDRSKTRNAVVEGYRHSLPAAQQYLISHPPLSAASITTRKIDVPRPKPLSTVVTGRTKLEPRSRSTLVLAVLEKVAEARFLLAAGDVDDTIAGEETRATAVKMAASQLPDSEAALINPGPFLCTPATPRVHSRLSAAGPKVYPSIWETTLAALQSTTPSTPPNTVKTVQVFTADCMSLLHTPVISRSPARPPVSGHRHATPQSILKVSRLACISPTLRGKSTQISRASVEPKRLSLALPQTDSPSLPPTPTTLSPSQTPTPPPVQSLADLEGSSSGTSLVTPRHIRFAQPEIHEISPLYVSPDNLARPPLHLFTEFDRENSAEELMLTSDDEITFNMSRPGTEMDKVDLVSPSSLPDTSQTSLQPHPSALELSPREPESNIETAAHIEEETVFQKSSISKSISQELVGAAVTSFKPDMELMETSAFEEEIEVEMIKTPEARTASSLIREEEAEKRTMSRDFNTSAKRAASSSVLVSETVAVTCRSVLRMVESQDEGVQVPSTTDMVGSSSAISLTLECQDGFEALTNSAAAMETIEPGEEELLMGDKNDGPSEDKWQTIGIVEVSDNEEEMGHVRIPTPITTPAVASATRHRGRRVSGAKQDRRSKFTFALSVDTQSAGEEKEAGTESGPTASKLQRTDDLLQIGRSPARETRMISNLAEAAPSAEAVAEAGNVETGTEYAGSEEPQPRKSTRSSSRMLTVDVSPQRSARSSVERSPPASPSRRSARNKSGKPPSPPSSPMRRSTRTTSRQALLSTLSPSSKNERTSPPSSPYRVLHFSPAQNIKDSHTAERSESSSHISSKVEDVKQEATTVTLRRSARRSRTPELAALSSSPGRSSKRLKESPESAMETASGVSTDSPLFRRQSSRQSQTAEVSPEVLNRRYTLRSHTPEASPELSRQTWSSRRSQTPEVYIPASPVRRSTRRSQTPEITAEHILPDRKAKPSEKTSVTRQSRHSSQKEAQGVDQQVAETASEGQRPDGRARRSPARTAALSSLSEEEAEAESDSSAKSSHKSSEVSFSGHLRSTLARSVGRSLVFEEESVPARSSRARSQEPVCIPAAPISRSRAKPEEEVVPDRSTRARSQELTSIPAAPTSRSRAKPEEEIVPDRSTRARSQELTSIPAVQTSRSRAKPEEEIVPDRSTRARSQELTSIPAAPTSRSLAVSEEETVPARSSRARSQEPASITPATRSQAVPGEETVEAFAGIRRRHKSTPERSQAPMTRLRDKGKGREGESEDKGLKVVTMETAAADILEEITSGMPVATLNSANISEAYSFQFAPPTPLTTLHSFQFAPPTPLTTLQADPLLAAPSDVSAFIFSLPLTRSAHRLAVRRVLELGQGSAHTTSGIEPAITMATSSLEPTVTMGTGGLDTAVISKIEPAITMATSSLEPAVTMDTGSHEPAVTMGTGGLEPGVTMGTGGLEPGVTIAASGLDSTVTMDTGGLVPGINRTTTSQEPADSPITASHKPQEEMPVKKPSHTTLIRNKKPRKLVAGASPTDSPINTLSPGESLASPSPAVRMPARRVSSIGMAYARKLKKRAAKLW